MCRAASMIVLRDRVLWSMVDSHESIIAEHGIAMDGVGGPNGVRVEIVPPGERYDAPAAEWVFCVDQDVLPPWWDAADGEARTRAALVEWLTARVFTSAAHEVREGVVWAYDSATVRAYDSATVRAYDSATVTAYDSATVTAYDSATVTAYGSATVRAYDSATVTAYDSATVTAYDSATVRAYGSATVTAYDSATVNQYSRSAHVELSGPYAVCIDRTGDRAACTVGAAVNHAEDAQ